MKGSRDHSECDFQIENTSVFDQSRYKFSKMACILNTVFKKSAAYVRQNGHNTLSQQCKTRYTWYLTSTEVITFLRDQNITTAWALPVNVVQVINISTTVWKVLMQRVWQETVYEIIYRFQCPAWWYDTDTDVQAVTQDTNQTAEKGNGPVTSDTWTDLCKGDAGRLTWWNFETYN